jgi:hypothetical protein
MVSLPLINFKVYCAEVSSFFMAFIAFFMAFIAFNAFTALARAMGALVEDGAAGAAGEDADGAGTSKPRALVEGGISEDDNGVARPMP